MKVSGSVSSVSMGHTMEREMSDRLEKVSGSMRELVAAVAGPKQWSDTRQSWLARAARKAGISYRQCKALWYGEIIDPYHRSARLMRDAAEQRASDLAGQFEMVARSMNATDPDFFGADVLALVHAARALRGVVGPRTDGET